jgi:ABC-type Fe3+/spermidine/putrescine transport system ATPase subunit
MLNITGLMKTYPGGIQALKGVNLEIPSGMFGLLGPNGSGKTTLMKIVATLLEPDEGKVDMNGLDLLTHKGKTRRILGYLPQEFGFYPTLTAEQTLNYLAKLKGVRATTIGSTIRFFMGCGVRMTWLMVRDYCRLFSSEFIGWRLRRCVLEWPIFALREDQIECPIRFSLSSRIPTHNLIGPKTHD